MRNLTSAEYQQVCGGKSSNGKAPPTSNSGNNQGRGNRHNAHGQGDAHRTVPDKSKKKKAG